MGIVPSGARVGQSNAERSGPKESLAKMEFMFYTGARSST